MFKFLKKIFKYRAPARVPPAAAKPRPADEQKEDRKASSESQVIPAASASQSQVMRNGTVFHVPKKSRGELIGAGGKVIKGLQDRFNVKINMPKSADNSTEVEVVGSASAVEATREEMSRIVGFKIGIEPLVTVYLDVPTNFYGKIIGSKGSVLKEIESKSECNVDVPQKDAKNAYVEVQGSRQNTARAKAEIERIIKQSVREVRGVKIQPEEVKTNAIVIDRTKPINEVLFFPDRSVEGAAFNRFLGFLASASNQLDVCVFTITDNRITAILQQLHVKGVKVRVLTDNDTAEADGSDIAFYQKIGIPVKFDRTEYHMHHKFAVVDRAILVNGSFNWTRAASTTNQENIVITNQMELVQSFQSQFNQMWNDEEHFSSKRVSTRKNGGF